VGIPARIIRAEEKGGEKPAFKAYGVTEAGDPVSEAMRGLVDSASSHEHEIALLWQAIERLTLEQRDSEQAAPGAVR
jgi:serine O-acetyltransferase